MVRIAPQWFNRKTKYSLHSREVFNPKASWLYFCKGDDAHEQKRQ